MNYIEYFKKGGKSSQAEDLAQKIFTAAKALQIPAEVVDAKLTELVNAGDQDTMAALQESVDSFISSNGQDQEAAQAIVSVFQSEQSSAMFKCGGKLQQLTDKFAKGGKSKCGCGGIKLDTGGDIKDKVKYKKHKDGSETLTQEGNVNGNYTKSKAEIHGKDTTLTQDIATHYGHRINKIDKDDPRYETVMKRLRKGLPKKENGGIVFAQAGTNTGYARAANYYRNHANESSIRKIQNFLAGRGYNVGDLDGKFGTKTYAAIQKYQQDNGLTADGMWGEDTNQLHRVLTYDNSTFSGKRSGAHPGKHTFNDNYAGFRYSDGTTGKTASMQDIGDAQALAISNYDWFTGNDPNAVKWRGFFRDSKDPRIQAMYNEILDSYTPGQRRAINYQQLPLDRRQENFNSRITEGTNQAAPYVAAALTAPVAAGELIMAPLTTGAAAAGGLAGGYLGGMAGRRIGDDISHPIYDIQNNIIGWSNINSEMYTDRNGRQIPVAVPSYGQTGEDIGEVAGAAIGTLAGGYASQWSPSATQYGPYQSSTTVYEQSPGTGASRVNVNSSPRGVARTTNSSSGHYGAGRVGGNTSSRVAQRTAVRNSRPRPASGQYGVSGGPRPLNGRMVPVREIGGTINKPTWINRIKK